MRILSIPASGTFELIKKCLIHAFPHPRSYDYTGLVTFRRTGGYMDGLYSVKKTIEIDFSKENWKEQLNRLSENERRCMQEYIHGREVDFGFKKSCYMFWLLKKEEVLLHEPRPPQNYNSHVYFDYDEISSGKELITIDSNKK